MPELNANKAILRASKELDAVLNLIADDIRTAVRKYGVKYKEPFWKNNKRLYNAVNKSIKLLNEKNLSIIQKSIESGWDISNSNMDKRVIEYIKEKDAVELLESKAYQNINKGQLIGFDIPVWEEWVQVNLPQLNAFLNRSVDGLRLSGRVWKVSLKVRKMIENVLKSGILEGKSAAEMSRILRQALKNPKALFRRIKNPVTGELELSQPAKNYHPGRGTYRSAFKNAFRLTRTETNMAYRFAENQRINQIPFVIGYHVHLSLSHPVFDICDSMTGRYPKNFVFIGWHPACFCYTTTIMLSDTKFKQYLNTGKIPATNYVQKIPKQASNYIKDNKKQINNLKTKPYWLRQNEKVIKNN